MRTKYPRTPHFSWSLGATNDDKILSSTAHLEGIEVIVTEKMDGENVSLYRDGFHARSIDSRHHVSRDWLAQFHSVIAQDIPENWRVCGENLYAKHSLGYTNLPSYFLGFSVWDADNVCLSWDDTLLYFELLGITPVRELWRGIFSEAVLKGLAAELNTEEQEGFVARPTASFHYSQFSSVVAKFVRAGHVTTTEHWAHSSIVPNLLRKGG